MYMLVLGCANSDGHGMNTAHDGALSYDAGRQEKPLYYPSIVVNHISVIRRAR